MEQRRYALGINNSAFFDGEISGLEKGEKRGILKSARAFRGSGIPLEQVIRILGLSPDDVAEL